MRTILFQKGKSKIFGGVAFDLWLTNEHGLSTQLERIQFSDYTFSTNVPYHNLATWGQALHLWPPGHFLFPSLSHELFQHRGCTLISVSPVPGREPGRVCGWDLLNEWMNKWTNSSFPTMAGRPETPLSMGRMKQLHAFSKETPPTGEKTALCEQHFTRLLSLFTYRRV